MKRQIKRIILASIVVLTITVYVSTVFVFAESHTHNQNCFSAKTHSHLGSKYNKALCYQGVASQEDCTGEWYCIGTQSNTGAPVPIYVIQCNVCHSTTSTSVSYGSQKIKDCTGKVTVYAPSCGYTEGEVETPVIHICEGNSSEKGGCYQVGPYSDICNSTNIKYIGMRNELVDPDVDLDVPMYQCQDCGYIQPYEDNCRYSHDSYYKKNCGKEDNAYYYLDNTKATIVCDKVVKLITAKVKNQTIVK